MYDGLGSNNDPKSWCHPVRSSSTLPPLQALRAFEAVARLLSFRRAGEELLISQSAVSHHIGELEKNLGRKLFIRKPRGIELTLEGERYFETVQRAFGIIASGTLDLRGRTAKGRVRVSLLPSFAANWLVPRLGRFAEAHPEIDLVFDPTLRLADLAAGDADIAIRYGDGLWEDGKSHLLMTERLTPIVSPALLRRGPKLTEPKDVLNHTLLMTLRHYEWDVWTEANGLDLTGARKIQLSDYNIVLQAVLDGQGIAIGRMLLIGDRLRNGALAPPPLNIVTSPRVGHWLVKPKRARLTPATTTFANWLTEEAAMAVSALEKAEASAG
jgi:LysR family transcriptional regulator, glycine cleavage system transcriptional activator